MKQIVQTRILHILSIIFLFICCISCDYVEMNTYQVKNEFHKPIRVRHILVESQPIYADSIHDIDTIIPVMGSVVLYEREGGIICATCKAEDHRDQYWDIDSLYIIIDDTLTFTKFSFSDYWDFTANKSRGCYTLKINEEKLK